MSAAGRVVFVGAGPGSADLVTLRGAARLRDAEVVLFDSLADPALRELAPHARWIDVGKRGFRGVAHGARTSDDNPGQATINALLVKHASEGKRVVRLKGGDPSVFGRLEEELLALATRRHRLRGGSRRLGGAWRRQPRRARPLTRRGGGRSVALATAMTHDSGLVAACHADTEVFYMAGKQLAGPRSPVARTGRLARATLPVLVVSRAGWPDELASEHRRCDCLGDAPRCCTPAGRQW